MRLLGRLHQPTLKLYPLAPLLDRLLVEGAGPGEGCDPHAVTARAIEQAVGDVGIHFDDELVHLLPGEKVLGQERIGDHECQMHRPLGGVFVEPHHPPKIRERLALSLVAGERFGLQVLDLGEHLLAARVVEGGEVAHEHGDFRHLLRLGKPHLLRGAVRVEAQPPLVSREVEGFLVRVGLELVAATEFLHETAGVIPGPLATKGGCQHQPRAVALCQREHRLGIDRVLRKPRRGQPACLGFGLGGAGRQADGQQHQRNPGG